MRFFLQVGPKKWLEPKTDEVLGELAKRGRRSVVVVPVAFTSDHIETLHELDIEFAEEAEKAKLKYDFYYNYWGCPFKKCRFIRSK